MFKSLAYKLQNFMRGRRGVDDLSRGLLLGAIVVVLVCMFLPRGMVRTVFYWIAFVAMTVAYVRALSTNIGKRTEENRAYVRLRTRIGAPINKHYARFTMWRMYHKTHKLFTCKQCGQSLRVPKGKGSVKVTCPKCKRSFTAKS